MQSNLKNKVIMETIASVKTPKGRVRVVHYVDELGCDAYRMSFQMWDGQRIRVSLLYTTADAAVKAMIQRAASDYLMKDLFNTNNL